MEKVIKPGNIGVITSRDSEALFLVDSVENGLIYLRSFSGPLVFTQCLPGEFWALFDSF